ncbi:MAG: DUF2577 domain-containing protein [Oscillospiraceae bacterium]|jgi:hypothetical protein|nr:DUF2577 domain-containing protein [Oscillospiraceae bacterium]
MGSETSLKTLIQSLMPDSTGIITGRVISANPLQIQDVNDMKFILHEKLLCLSRHLTDYTAACDIVSLNLRGAVIKINNALQVGDIVYLLSFNEGKKYYILDRAV